MTHKYTENRIARAGAVRRIALDPVRFRGERVIALTGGEYIRFTVFNADGTVLIGTTDGSYETIYMNDDGDITEAWTGIIDVGTTVQLIKVVWEVHVGAGKERYTDTIDVQASAFAGRSAQVLADGEVV